MEPSNRMRAGDAERDTTIAVLREALANGRLTMDEFDERQSQALAARFLDELGTMTTDLPEARQAGESDAAIVRRQESVAVPGSRPPVNSIAVMSGHDIVVEPGVDQVSVLSFWGGHDILLDEAMGPGVEITLTLNSIMGGCDVFVPPGVRVLDQSFGLMGGNSISKGVRGDGSNGTVIIKGLQFWGGNDIKPSKG